MKTNVIFALGSLLLLVFQLHSATCTAVSSGDWTDPSTWSCGSEPGCGDLVIIPASFVVTIDDHVNLDENSMPACSIPTHIIVYGTLDFSTGKKIYLACGSSVEIMVGGSMDPGSGGGTSNLIEICQQEEWKAGDGPVSGYKLYGTQYPLALEFIRLDGSVHDGVLNLNWIVQSEKGNAFFTLRYSENDSLWGKRIVPSVGDHEEVIDYQLEIPLEAFSGNSILVELSATDVDGRTEQLALQSFSIKRGGIMIFPNPVGETGLLKVTGTVERDKVSILSNEGKNMQTPPYNFSDGVLVLDVSSLAAGIYWLEINNDRPIRFVKQ